MGALEPTPPNVEGYSFSGWSHNFSSITSNTTVNAIYTINTYTVTFDTGSGVEIDSLTQIEYGSTIDLPIPTKEGYVFKGWYTGTTINDVQFTNQSIITKDITLYARWNSEMYSVKFIDLNHVVIHEVIVFSGESAVAPTMPEIIGYTFIGWTQPFNNITEDTVTKVVYSINQYTLTFDSRGGSYVSPIKQDYATTIIEPTHPIKEGYTFEGWFSDLSYTSAYTFTTVPAQNINLMVELIVQIHQYLPLNQNPSY